MSSSFPLADRDVSVMSRMYEFNLRWQ